MNKCEANFWRHVMDVAADNGSKEMELRKLWEENDELKKRNKVLSETLIQLQKQFESEKKQDEATEHEGA